MINKILNDIEEIKTEVNNIRDILIDMNVRLNELEFRAGLYTPEEDQEYAESTAVAEALENPPEDNIEEEEEEEDNDE
jgi:hypothetical protein